MTEEERLQGIARAGIVEALQLISKGIEDGTVNGLAFTTVGPQGSQSGLSGRFSAWDLIQVGLELSQLTRQVAAEVLEMTPPKPRPKDSTPPPDLITLARARGTGLLTLSEQIPIV